MILVLTKSSKPRYQDFRHNRSNISHASSTMSETLTNHLKLKIKILHIFLISLLARYFRITDNMYYSVMEAVHKSQSRSPLIAEQRDSAEIIQLLDVNILIEYETLPQADTCFVIRMNQHRYVRILSPNTSLGSWTDM